MKHSAQRVGVFVDVQNMYYSARALFEQRVDFGEILKEAIGERQLVRAFAYVIQADKEDEKSFFDALKERGFELRSKELLNFYGGNQKGDWDVGISMDVVRMVPKLDVVVLVSGDGDFAELLKYVKAHGCRAEVLAFGSSASSALREEADTLVDLSKDTKRFLIPKKGGKKGRAQYTKNKANKSSARDAAPTTNGAADTVNKTQQALNIIRATKPPINPQNHAASKPSKPTSPAPSPPTRRFSSTPTKVPAPTSAPAKASPPKPNLTKPSVPQKPVNPIPSSKPRRIPRITT